MTKDDNKSVVSQSPAVSQFLSKVAATPVPAKLAGKGRLVFAMDATASREPTWDRACHLHAEMFAATEALGGLQVQLCYYRGFREFNTSRWCHSAAQLLSEMSAVKCLGGHTQITRVLAHALEESAAHKVQAVVFVGDAMEEHADRLCDQAGRLGMLNIPLFMFQEGKSARVRSVFQQLAKLSGGAYAPFDLSSASQLRQLMSAVAVFAAGGRQALAHLKGREPGVTQLLEQIRG